MGSGLGREREAREKEAREREARESDRERDKRLDSPLALHNQQIHWAV